MSERKGATKSGAVAVCCGVFWAIGALLQGTIVPEYWSAGSATDYAAVVLYSAALASLAFCIWQLRGLPARIVHVGAVAASLGLGATGGINLIEDGFHVEALGLGYVVAFLVGTVALVPLTAGLAMASGTRRIALITGATFVGLLLVAQWYGGAVLGVTWLCAGSLQVVGGIDLEQRSGRGLASRPASSE